MKKLILIIGAPGSGKTTDAQLIAQRNSDTIAHYSTGDLLRAEVASGSKRGETIHDFISKGQIVPIEIAVETILSAINNTTLDTIIIDGYPRSSEQMLELDKFLSKEDHIKLVAVIEVDVSEETARNRVFSRARGEDDKLEIFNNRMRIYLEPLNEIESFYKSKGILHKIDGEDSIENIVQKMEQFIKNKIESTN